MTVGAVGTPPFVITNDQLLYNLAKACIRTALNQYGDSGGYAMETYFRQTFENHYKFKKGLSRPITSINWAIVTETVYDYFKENGVGY
jgi:hypothetical protein